jgi:superfamily I DNA/RNA helicase
MYNDLLLARNRLYLTGPFGSGKTTLAIERIKWLLRQERVRGDDILVLTPQRTLARPYYEALRAADVPPGPPVRVTTFAGLARAAVELYWPLLAEKAGFADPRQEPIFLNLETAQYHMEPFVKAAFEQAEFDAIRVEPSRVVSQVLDNLNKAALLGFSIEETYQRLELAVPQGQEMTARLNVLQTAKRISRQFRELCMRESLVDFSLWIELFESQVLANDWSRTHLFRSQRHLVMDNAEEDTHAAQSLARRWIPHLDSALIVVDEDAGYRVFLGANPEGAAALAEVCDLQLPLTESYLMPRSLERMARIVDKAVRGRRAVHDGDLGLKPQATEGLKPQATEGLKPQAIVQPQVGTNGMQNGREDAIHTPLPLVYRTHRFYPQMINWTVDEIEQLVRDRGVAPGQIAILAPFVSDALRFSLQSRLTARGIPSTTHRPSRALNAEPAARALLTLAALAHPTWQRYPQPSDVTLTFGVAIEDLDPVRATLLGRVAYGIRGQNAGTLAPFPSLKTPVQGRITFRVGEQYERLRRWIETYQTETTFTPLDQFFARIFGELLSQPGFGFHQNVDAARVTNQLVESARNFRWAIEESGGEDPQKRTVVIGRVYLELIESGALGALYVPGWQEDEEVVFIAPAYTFLMRNRAVDIQFWLDIGAGGWWERLYQPLTHPHVLSRQWPTGALWSDFHEYQQRQETLRRLMLGLIRRTRQGIYLGMSDYGESGMEQRGPLLNLLNRVLVQEQQDPIGVR